MPLLSSSSSSSSVNRTQMGLHLEERPISLDVKGKHMLTHTCVGTRTNLKIHEIKSLCASFQVIYMHTEKGHTRRFSDTNRFTKLPYTKTHTNINLGLLFIQMWCAHLSAYTVEWRKGKQCDNLNQWAPSQTSPLNRSGGNTFSAGSFQ